jgi:hypothetical protein
MCDLDGPAGAGGLYDSVDHLQCLESVSAAADRLSRATNDIGEMLHLIGERIGPLDGLG